MRKTNDDPSGSDTQQDAELELVQKVLDGDAAAARLVVGQHLAPITRYSFRMLGDAAEAEDIAQETFLRLWRDLSRWESRAKLATWLHRVAHNLCIDRIRSRRTAPLVTAPEPLDPGGEAGEQMEAIQQSRAVAAALAELPERQRAAVTLVYHQGLSNRQAAEVLGVDVDALESLLVRGRQNLRKRLVQGSSHSAADRDAVESKP